ASGDSPEVVAKSHEGTSNQVVPLNLQWPPGVFSLSHLAVPVSANDPVYGTAEATEKTGLPLGSLSLRGENGVLRVSDGQVIRLRHNPFYEFTEDRAVDWLVKILKSKGFSM
ncbi:MAG: hypothetical protein ABI680_11800, partial [Chthoniobacteraceae bacterium]